MLPKVFIDGRTGTTGLSIYEWMEGREDVEVLTLPLELRRDSDSRKERISESDVTILCLPDAASIEAARWAGASDTRVSDASTAHRVTDGAVCVG